MYSIKNNCLVFTSQDLKSIKINYWVKNKFSQISSIIVLHEPNIISQRITLNKPNFS
uniref:Uncharacterized protein n=1 Tax=Anguilla anguilla TaxID=7936 RepID=A0A0E9S0R0_ANGAN